MNGHSLAVGLALSIALTALALPCVPEGGSIDLQLPRPKLPPAPPGAPGPSGWTGDPPVAMEHDTFSPDDPMGAAVPKNGGQTAKTSVTNAGGELKGPNGVTQNGGSEGECIEVEICWTYTTWRRVTYFAFTETGFVTGSILKPVTLRKCSDPVKVCPC